MAAINAEQQELNTVMFCASMLKTAARTEHCDVPCINAETATIIEQCNVACIHIEQSGKN